MKNENLGLWTIVSQRQDIEYQQKFFGLISHLIYSPTDSDVVYLSKYYVPSYLNDLQELFEKDEKTIIQQAAQGKHLKDTMNGNLCLELCWSADKQFVAIRLQRFSDLLYHPITDVRYFTGEAACAVSKIIG